MTTLTADPYVFTVSEPDNCAKPTLYAKMTSKDAIYNQSVAKRLVNEWFEHHIDICPSPSDFEDLVYNMRKQGYEWLNQQYLFELTPIEK